MESTSSPRRRRLAFRQHRYTNVQMGEHMLSLRRGGKWGSSRYSANKWPAAIAYARAGLNSPWYHLAWQPAQRHRADNMLAYPLSGHGTRGAIYHTRWRTTNIRCPAP